MDAFGVITFQVNIFIENDSLQLFTDLNNYTKGELANFVLTKQNLTVSSFPKLIQVDYKTKKVKLKNKGIYSFVCLKKDTLLYTDKNQIKYSLKEGEQFPKLNLNITDSIYDNKWNYCFLNNKLLLYTYNFKTESSRFFYEDNKELNQVLLNQRISIFYTENNNIWFCSQSGIFVFEYKRGKFNYLTTYFKG